jgi:hypothetical protein
MANLSGNVIDWMDHASVSYSWTQNVDGSWVGSPAYRDGTQVQNDPRFPIIRYPAAPSSSVLVQAPTNVYANPGTAVTPPNAGVPLAVTGNPGSTGDPANDENRRAAGVVPGTSIVFGH